MELTPGLSIVGIFSDPGIIEADATDQFDSDSSCVYLAFKVAFSMKLVIPH